MRKTGKCSLLFPMRPTCNKAVLSAFPSERLLPLSSARGSSLEESHPGNPSVVTALCLPSCVVTEPATPVGAHTCGSIPGPMTRLAGRCPGSQRGVGPTTAQQFLGNASASSHGRFLMEMMTHQGIFWPLYSPLFQSAFLGILVFFLSLKIKPFLKLILLLFSPHQTEDFSEQFGGKQAMMTLWRNSWSSL